MYQNNTEAEILQSYHKENEIYYIDFIIKSMDISVGKVYVASCGFSMYYYDNTRFLSEPYIQRIEDHLPWRFTNEMRRMSYFSLRIESFIIFSYTSNLTAPLEDVIFYLALGNAGSAKIYWGTDLVFETEPYVCYGKFLTENDRCCAQMKTFHVHNVNITGIIPYYLRIDYKHKESEPCIRLYRESPTM
jgi:hypothetical protein